jgi:D-methionine transport system permease protein
MTNLLIKGTLDTLTIVSMSTLFSMVGGLPLGILLTVWKKDGIAPFAAGEKLLSGFVNIVRSIPFIILIIALFPFTRLIVGRSYGIEASIVALVVGAIPFVARLVESAFAEVDEGLIKAAITMGATPLQIVRKVYLVESIPALIRLISLTMITLVGYAAMAGVVGGGGLGDIAIRYGLHRYQTDVMLLTIVIMVMLVQLIQSGFNFIANRLDRRRA